LDAALESIVHTGGLAAMFREIFRPERNALYPTGYERRALGSVIKLR
jgi:hypothetical protein